MANTTFRRRPTRTTNAATSPTRSISAELGLEGWQHLDPVLLASLALEAPPPQHLADRRARVSLPLAQEG